jgi:hypothetical protein
VFHVLLGSVKISESFAQLSSAAATLPIEKIIKNNPKIRIILFLKIFPTPFMYIF